MNPNPTDTIIALEKALEAGPTAGSWQWVEPEHDQPQLPDDENFRLSLRTVEQFPARFGGGTLPKFILEAEEFCGETQKVNAANAQWITACSPLAIRTLLDAHASALRDAARLDWLVSQLSDRDFREFGLNYRCGDDSIRGAIDSKLAALDDNTKGAAAAIISSEPWLKSSEVQERLKGAE